MNSQENLAFSPEFSANDIKLAETVASDIAAALDNARLLEQEKHAAAAEAR